MSTKQAQDHACHGSDWPEHEDFLVGNREGLEKLKLAITEALENGQSPIDSGEFVGVRCLDTSFFENQKYDVSRGSQIIGWSVGITVLVVLAIGIRTIFSWFSSAC